MEPMFDVLAEMDTPVLVFHKDGRFLYANRSGASLLPEQVEEWRWPAIADVLPKDHLHRLHPFTIGDVQGIVIECTPRKEVDLQHDVFRLERNVAELERIIDGSSDELFVTDEEGRILLVTSRVEELYGIKKSDLIGKSVFELERDHVFYPSATALVLRDKSRHTILQTTSDGRQLAVTGNPVFDEEGRIVRVISAAIDMREMPWVLNLGQTGTSAESPAEMSALAPEYGVRPLVASSTPMKQTLATARRAAQTDATVLLLGETGVGKNRFARYIHEASPRRSGPLVEVNCAAIPETLFESELFGYERGAFTGSNREGKVGKVEVAHGGTLFLNEIGELPLSVQAKLLDFIQYHSFQKVGGVRTYTVDVRVIAATNRDLAQMVSDKQFRQDLYYRLNVIPIAIPALRNHMEDLEALAATILSEVARRYHLPVKHLHPAALARFHEYDWPGNVRELENVLERLCVTLDEGLILPGHLPTAFTQSKVQSTSETASVCAPQTARTNTDEPRTPAHDDGIGRLQDMLDAYELDILREALAKYKTTYAMANALHISQPTVVRKLKRYGLTL